MRLYGLHEKISCSQRRLQIIEVESRTQPSRPRQRTQKKSRPRPRTDFSRTHPLEAKAKADFSRIDPLEAKAKDEGHKAQVFYKKKVPQIFFRRPPKNTKKRNGLCARRRQFYAKNQAFSKNKKKVFPNFPRGFCRIPR